MTLYHRHFDLQRSPFSIAPDPQFLYMSERHREALAHLEWGLSGAGGFVLLTGEVGTGKTTLCRCLLERVPDDTEVAFVINPRVTAAELLTTICEELGDPPPEADQGSVKRLVDRINRRLLDAHGRGERVVLVIDEAQNLAVDVLEQVRLLTNLETNERKLLQVILLGQPELATLLDAPELRQLAQRVTARYHLRPLSAEELAALVQHRLAVAGARRNPFTGAALAALHRRSKGIPRVANVIADRALLGAYAEGIEEIDARIVRRAAKEVLGEGRGPGRARRIAGIAALLVLGIGIGIAGAVMTGRLQSDDRATSARPDADRATVDASLPAIAPDSPAAGAGAPRADAEAPTPVPATGRAPGPAAQADAAADVAETSAPALPTEPAPPPPASAIDPLAILWDDTGAATRLDAVRALLDAWYTPVDLRADAAPCTGVGAAGLRCLEEQGTWSDLLERDRPAVLELWRAGGSEPRYVALLGVASDRARLDVGGASLELPRATLERYWRGRATVLWQMPPDYVRPSRTGDDDVTTAWLAERLTLLDGEAVAGEEDGRFDAALEQRVRRFQMSAGLRPDGIVGPRTWMRLNDATGLGAPRLRTP